MLDLADPQVEDTHPAWQPGQLDSIADTGLSPGFLHDLALKIMYFRGQISGSEVANAMRLPFQTVVREVMDFLRREQMCEVVGSEGVGAGSFQYVLTDKGDKRARERLERTTYADAAPVTWSQYLEAMNAQGGRQLDATPELVRKALSHLVLNQKLLGQIGPAINSGRSVFLYGPPGNGKTTIAEAVGRLVLGADMYVPYSIELDGQIITIFDRNNHEVVEELATTGESQPSGSGKTDRRWVLVRRPVVMVGGELTLAGLELQYDDNAKFYEAPFQMKANGGMLIIDDFGRQLIRPRDLLNRWIVPMERKADFLSLHTGRKLEMPFNVMLIFSTNLPPRDLVDEAFLRRIRHKIHVVSPVYDEFREIFIMECERHDIEFDDSALRYLLEEYYVKVERKIRGNHPRDILDQIVDIAGYLKKPPSLDRNLLDSAAASYFVDL